MCWIRVKVPSSAIAVVQRTLRWILHGSNEPRSGRVLRRRLPCTRSSCSVFCVTSYFFTTTTRSNCVKCMKINFKLQQSDHLTVWTLNVSDEIEGKYHFCGWQVSIGLNRENVRAEKFLTDFASGLFDRRNRRVPGLHRLLNRTRFSTNMFAITMSRLRSPLIERIFFASLLLICTHDLHNSVDNLRVENKERIICVVYLFHHSARLFTRWAPAVRCRRHKIHGHGEFMPFVLCHGVMRLKCFLTSSWTQKQPTKKQIWRLNG